MCFKYRHVKFKYKHSTYGKFSIKFHSQKPKSLLFPNFKQTDFALPVKRFCMGKEASIIQQMKAIKHWNHAKPPKHLKNQIFVHP